MSVALPWLDMKSHAFPPIENALTDPNGLLAVGGDLSPNRLKVAYSQGIFPWFSDGEPILWWSPTPRAIIPTKQLKINRTLRKVLSKPDYNVTLNNAFNSVISLCAKAPFRKEGTWITDEMLTAYCRLHELGFAHSVEVWKDEELIGGLYGVAINGYFSGESMFYTKPNGSKLALVYLCELLKSQNIQFVDCQISNPFLADMGCIEIQRSDFVHFKQQELLNILPNYFWHTRDLKF